MPIYAVTGKLGTGKTKFAVYMASEALRAGRRVASNVDLELAPLCKVGQVAHYVRLPDKPSREDFDAAGHGNPGSYDEDRNGVMILDELGTWLNARGFQDKGRAGILDFLVHARKLGWDVFLIVQGLGMIDKQVRDDLVEFEVRNIRLDKVRLPFVGGLLNDAFGGRVGYLPRLHLATARLVASGGKVVAQRWTYKGDWLHQAYDTRQVFSSDYPHGPHTVLHPHYWVRPLRPARLVHRLGLAKWRPEPESAGPVRQLKPKHPHVAALQLLPPDERIKAARVLLPALQPVR